VQRQALAPNLPSSSRGWGNATVLEQVNKRVLAMLGLRLRVAALPPRRGVVDPPCTPCREGGVGTKGAPTHRHVLAARHRTKGDHEQRVSRRDNQVFDLLVAREGGRPTPRLRSTAVRRR
jgi:hypothetical protein